MGNPMVGAGGRQRGYQKASRVKKAGSQRSETSKQSRMATTRADAPLWPGLIASVLDPPLVSVRAAGIPRSAALSARRVRSVPGARRVRSRAHSVPGSRRVRSRARSVPGARRVRFRARSVPGARRVRSRARSVPGARRVRYISCTAVHKINTYSA